MLLLGLAAKGGVVRGQDYAARARSTTPTAAAEQLDASSAASSLDLRTRSSLPTSLGEVLHEAPGAHARSSGGLGAYSAVALRGGDDDETLVLLDDVPLVAPDGRAFDLGMFAPALFERIDVFRGGAPVWLNSGAIGGALRLVPRRDPQTSASAALGGGSFERLQSQAAGSVVREAGLALQTLAVVRGSRGDYPYLDDRGTRLVGSDDVVRRRGNADYVDAQGLADLRLALPSGRLHLLALGAGQTSGFPGPGAAPTPDIRRSGSRALLAATYERDGARADQPSLQLLASGAFSREQYTDRFGQLGTSRRSASDDLGLRAFLRGAGRLPLTRWLEATLSAQYALDALLPHDSLARLPLDSSLRHDLSAAFELAAEARLGSVRLGLRGSARLEWSRIDLHAPPLDVAPLTADDELVAPTFRAGAFAELLPGLTLQASAASGVRVPTVFELFGDRGLVLPSPDLKPVHALGFDAGLRLHGQTGALRGRLELHGFQQTRRDVIAVVRTSQWQLSHQNLSRVEQWGLELGGSAQLEQWLHLHAALTGLDSSTALDKRLPFRPELQVYARPELRLPLSASGVSALWLGAELWYRSFAYVDRANLAYVPSCTQLSFTAALATLRDVLRFEARLDDVADARCSDWVGYPLPGRSVFFSIRYQESFDDRA